MRNVVYFIGIILIVFLNSCKKEEFDTNAEYKEVTVIYGILDVNETKQYVKVNKGFQNVGTNALELAKDDAEINNYLDSIIVEIEELATNGDIIQTVELSKELVLDKDTGAFNVEGNYWYTVDASQLKLNPIYTYNVKVTNTITKKVSEASTGIISNRSIKLSGSNKYYNNLCWLSPRDFTYEICDEAAIPNIKIIGSTGPTPQEIEFNTAKYAGIYKIYVELNYYEFINDDLSTKENIVFKFSVSSNEYKSYEGEVKISLSGESFFRSLVASIDTSADDETMKRVAEDIDITIVAGGVDFAEYMKANNAFSSITQTKPFYTNVYDNEGNQGVGLVTTRYFKKVKGNFLSNIEPMKLYYPSLKFQ